MGFFDGLKSAAGWAWDHSPAGITSEFVGGVTGIDGKDIVGDVFTGDFDSLGEDLLEPLTGNKAKQEAYDEAMKTLNDQQTMMNAGYGTAQGMVADSRGEIADIIGPEAMDLYKSQLYQLTPSSYAASTEPLKGFEFERDVSKYLDPSAQYQIDQATQQVLQSMSGMGGISGGAASRAIAAETGAKASELYGDAFDRMMKATEQEYGKNRDIVSAEQAGKNTAAGLKQTQLEGMGNLAGSYVGNLQGLTEDQVNLLLAQMGSNLSLAQAMSQLGIDVASQPTTTQQLLGMAGDASTIYKNFAG
jgi:hypothetical protein